MTAYEMDSKWIHPGRFILGMLLGSLAGALTLLLIAPQSGKDTRQLIKTKTIELRDQTTETVKNVSGQARSKAGEIKVGVSNKAKELTQKSKEVLAMQLDHLSAAAQNGKKALLIKGDGSR